MPESTESDGPVSAGSPGDPGSQRPLRAGSHDGSPGLGEGLARVYETRLPDPEGERLALWEKEWGDDFYVLRSQSVGWPSHEPVNRHGLPDRTHSVAEAGGRLSPGDPGRQHDRGDAVQARGVVSRTRCRRSTTSARPGRRSSTVALWGWSTRQERRAFVELARPYEPDLVLLVVCLNDMEELQNNLSRPSSILGWLHRRSALVRRLVNAEERSIRDVEELLSDSDNTRRAQERFFDELERLRRRRRGHGRGPGGPAPSGGVAGRETNGVAAAPGEGGRLVRRARGTLPRPARRAARGPRPLRGHRAPLAGGPPRPGALRFSTPACYPKQRPARSALARPSVAPIRRRQLSSPCGRSCCGGDSFRARAEAAWQIGRRSPPPRIVPSLVAALRDDSEAVRAEAARALGALEEPPAEVLAGLTRALDDERQAVRWRAVESLVALRPAFEAVWPGIERGLESDDPYVRGGVLWCLREIGPSAAPRGPGPAPRPSARPGPRRARRRHAGRRGAGGRGRRDARRPGRQPARAGRRRCPTEGGPHPGTPRPGGGSRDARPSRRPRRSERARPDRGRHGARADPGRGIRGSWPASWPPPGTRAASCASRPRWPSAAWARRPRHATPSKLLLEDEDEQVREAARRALGPPSGSEGPRAPR